MSVIMFPGQGSQFKGMGKNLFGKYKKEVKIASDILGYDIKELCLLDKDRLLGKTQYTQPAMYVYNALGYYEFGKKIKPSYILGHSLGEYNALLAAGVFDFATGLKMVQKRGDLMGSSSGGSMAAVLGLELTALERKLKTSGFEDIDIANLNTPTQIVISGPTSAINKVITDFDKQKIRIIPLFVSAPFHSRYMKEAADEFSIFLEDFELSPLKIPVVANATARPYENNKIAELLSDQIYKSVQWSKSINYLLDNGAKKFDEVGGIVLSKMVTEIKAKYQLIKEDSNTKNRTPVETKSIAHWLGSKSFRDDYGINYSYLVGSNYNVISSEKTVICMGKAGMIAFLGTWGASLDKLESWIINIKKALVKEQAYGVSLSYNILNPHFEVKIVELFLKYRVENIEASGYLQITDSLVRFRLTGLKRDVNGEIHCKHKIIAKVSRPEIAKSFMLPAPKKIVKKLLEEKLITPEQALLSENIPMSHDICVVADSGGPTDRGVAMVLLPSILSLRKEMGEKHEYANSIRVGLTGGIGTPEAIVCAFIMGADFVITGSINQCTVQAEISNSVKDMLQEMNVQDTTYCPSGEMFEIGAKLQVLKKGVLFPARANKLYTIYNQYDSLSDIPTEIIKDLEKNIFKRTIDSVWLETKKYHIDNEQKKQIDRAEVNPKYKMALIFKWYFGYTSKLAFEGNIEKKVDFQIHTGPSLGAFNQWVKGTSAESWRSRNVDEIAIKLMEAAGKLIEKTTLLLKNQES